MDTPLIHMFTVSMFTHHTLHTQEAFFAELEQLIALSPA